MEFVGATTGSLYATLEAEKLGDYSRELQVAIEYGGRLLRKAGWDDNAASEVLETLVHGYPSHGYIIDCSELGEMGFEAEFFPDDQQPEIEALFGQLFPDTETIQFVEPVSDSTPSQNGNPNPESASAVEEVVADVPPQPGDHEHGTI